MALHEIKAGGKIDTLNKDELREVMRTVTADWFNQVSRGDRYRRFSAEGTIAAGALTIGGAEQRDAVLGPKDGFVWAVKRVALFGLTTYDDAVPSVFSEPVRLHLNDEGPGSLVHPAVQGYQGFNTDELVLYPGDTLLAVGAGLQATGTIVLTGQARELPMPLAWRIGG